jgi:hypothetical protein
MPSGVEHINVIDVVAHDEKRGEIALIMIESRAWDGSDERLFQLQEKINAYLSFALDGEMIETYPAFAGIPARLQLDCASAPDPRTRHFIEIVRQQIAFQEIKFSVRVIEPGACDSGCGCHESSRS